MNIPKTITIEEMTRITGSVYRTIRGRLEAEGVEPVGKDGQRILYPRRAALRAFYENAPGYMRGLADDMNFLGYFYGAMTAGGRFAEAIAEEMGNGTPPEKVAELDNLMGRVLRRAISAYFYREADDEEMNALFAGAYGQDEESQT